MDGIKEHTIGNVDLSGQILFRDTPPDYRNHEIVVYVMLDGTRMILRPDGTCWKDWKGHRVQVKTNYKGFVTVGTTSKSLRKMVATFFVPNPAGMLHVWALDGDVSNTSPGNLKWSTCMNRYHLREKAKKAEANPKDYPEIFSPKIQTPQTITLKSKV